MYLDSPNLDIYRLWSSLYLLEEQHLDFGVVRNSCAYASTSELVICIQELPKAFFIFLKALFSPK